MFRRLESVPKMATEIGIAYLTMRNRLRRARISDAELEAIRIETARARCATELKALAAKLGRTPTTSEMPQSLYTRIGKYWGMVSHLRSELGLPPPKMGNPRIAQEAESVRARKRLLAQVVGQEGQQTVLEFLSDGKVATAHEISATCGIARNRLLGLLRKLIAIHEVVRIGQKKSARYQRNGVTGGLDGTREG